MVPDGRVRPSFHARCGELSSVASVVETEDSAVFAAPSTSVLVSGATWPAHLERKLLGNSILVFSPGCAPCRVSNGTGFTTPVPVGRHVPEPCLYRRSGSLRIIDPAAAVTRLRIYEASSFRLTPQPQL